MSRSDISSSGASDCGSSYIAAHGSPSAASRAGASAIVHRRGSTASSSSQRNGIDTGASG